MNPAENDILDYNYPYDELPQLKELLEKWGLQCVYQTCVDQLIDIKMLSIMKTYHVEKLLSKFPWGIIFKFEFELTKWQTNNSIVTVSNDHNSSTNLGEIVLCSSSTPIVEYFHKSPNIKYQLKVDEVLNSTTQGALILSYYEKNNKLNDGIRSTLVDILIGSVLSQKLPMSVILAESIADQIVVMFKSEVKDVYFMKIGNNKNPKGKLYAKYYNCLRNLKNNGLVPTSAVKHKTYNDKHQKTNWTEREFVSEIEIDGILDILKHGNSTFPELESMWNATINYRLNNIKCATSTADILKTWKHYLLPYGHKLIDIDYNALFPITNNIYHDFNDKAEKIIKLLDEKVKDTNCRKILENLVSNNNDIDMNENVKNAALFYLLHAMFAPTSRKVTTDSNGKKNMVKYSIKDSQDSFIVFKESVEAQQHHLEQLRNRGIPIQPFILIVGTMNVQKEILVYFDSVMYKVHSVLRSIEVCFKIFHLFNLEYPSQSAIVWQFIQKYFFCVHSRYDTPFPKLVQILAELNQ
ncbi:unnamed protein product [Macrosiphum euphorbiae]|uniref:Uncharacterized protein n=1 Tax=Macrosiphum euphorbiae TaxID=13131 RepID=A0AAV0XDT9_9HEMI|nr:unnamed protein product [Macrosiphum euphorbiae]